jgi:glycogen debranching enzyme
MKASHFWKNLSIEKEVGSDAGFLLANKKGGYASFCFPNISRYNGFFIYENKDMFKILDEIRVKDSGKISHLKNYFYCADAYFDKCRQRFFVPSKTNTLAVEFDGEKEMELLFDMKKSFDNDDKGRMYEVEVKGNNAVIKYTKMKNGVADYKICAVIRTNGKIEKKDEWIKKDFPFDRKRNSPPYEWYNYSCLKIKANKILITAYADEKKAEKESSKIFSEYRSFLDRDAKIIQKFRFPAKVPLSTAFAYLSCWNSMKGLVYDDSAFAGFPWFFQFWARDSAVAMKALIDSGDYNVAKTILHGLLSMIDSKGVIKTRIGFYNKESESLDSADAAGWVCLRFCQLLRELDKKKNIRSFISKKEEKELAKGVENAVLLLKKFKTKDGLAYNDVNETWMDTDAGNDKRAGARIEIQALRLAMLRLAFKLTKKKRFKDDEDALKRLVIKRFWNGNYLNDGADDSTVRPNIFLAAYIYPDLLSEKDWIRCFSSALDRLWLDWGGLSTIDKSNRLFCDEYTGENNRSYHRGDSWFWINNYAALVMSKLASGRFKTRIEKIIEASCEQILWKGMLACHAELSSAKELRSEGCWSQLWSSASFIELVDGLYSDKK